MTDKEKLLELAEWHDAKAGMSAKGSAFVKWHLDQARLIRRLLSLLPKEGEVMVPEEPTEEMLNAQYRDAGVGRDLARKCYKAMTEAAKGKP